MCSVDGIAAGLKARRLRSPVAVCLLRSVGGGLLRRHRRVSLLPRELCSALPAEPWNTAACGGAVPYGFCAGAPSRFCRLLRFCAAAPDETMAAAIVIETQFLVMAISSCFYGSEPETPVNASVRVGTHNERECHGRSCAPAS
jgi:hypothetical protein